MFQKGGKERPVWFFANNMNNITIAFLAASGVFLVLGVFMVFYKPKEKGIEKSNKFDPDYSKNLRRFDFEKGSIEETFSYLLDEYSDNKFMTSLLEKSVAYLEGEYGDYETALSMMNINEDEELENINNEILRMEIGKHWALPMK